MSQSITIKILSYSSLDLDTLDLGNLTIKSILIDYYYFSSIAKGYSLL